MTQSNILYLVVLVALMFFLMIWPNMQQQKKHKQLISSLQVKDKVVTTSGIYGTITKIKEDTIMVKVATNVEIEFLKAAVKGVESKAKETNSNKKDKVEQLEDGDNTPDNDSSTDDIK